MTMHLLMPLKVKFWLISHVSITASTLYVSGIQVVPLLMKAIGWQGGSILALETLKRVVVAGNRARDALVAQGLK